MFLKMFLGIFVEIFLEIFSEYSWKCSWNYSWKYFFGNILGNILEVLGMLLIALEFPVLSIWRGFVFLNRDATIPMQNWRWGQMDRKWCQVQKTIEWEKKTMLKKCYIWNNFGGLASMHQCKNSMCCKIGNFINSAPYRYIL